MGFFSLTKHTLQREIQRIRAYPIYLTLMVLLPVLSFALFVVLFEKGVPQDIPIAVMDQDHSTLSRKLTSMIDATPTANVNYDINNMGEGERMVREGLIQAIVYIPEGFEKDIYSMTQTSVVSYINGTNLSANGLLGKDLQTVITTFSSGVQIQMLMKKGLSQSDAYNMMMPISFDKHVLFNPYINYGYYLLPSFMPMMLMIFALMITIFAIGTELKASTSGEWFATAGGKIAPAVIGKLLPYTLAMFVMSLLMNTIMYKWVGVPLNGSIALIIISGLLFVLAYQSIGVLIIALLSNMRLSLSIGGGYSVLAFTFSGLTFPLMAMDGYIQVIAHIFPFTLYTEVFIDQALRGAPAIYSVQYLGWMSLFIILPMLALPRLKMVATNEKFWGRL